MLRLPMLGMLLGGALVLHAGGCSHDKHDKHAHPKHPPKVKAVGHDHKEKAFDLANPAERDALFAQLEGGEIEHLEVDKGMPNPMELVADTAIWAIVIFLALLFILRKAAWGPMLEGLKKREESIKGAVEEAKLARAETVRVTTEFKAKMDQAYAEIPKMLEEARRDAQNLAEEMRAKANQDIQAERARLRREIDLARDQALQEIWNQAAQLATLISAKAIGRALTEDDHRRLIDEALAEMTSERRT